MTKANKTQEQHTAGPIAIGFDYQIYLFMSLALELGPGEKIGFEVKDDIHIDKANGKTILYQAKHTVQQGSNKNLTTLDSDLWKTLSNWVDFIKSNKDNSKFIEKHSFILTTNKSENNNEFLSALLLFKTDSDTDTVLNKLKELKAKTKDKNLKNYIQNVISLRKKNLKAFLTKLTIDTDTDEIIEKIKNQISKSTKQNKQKVDAVFNSLYSNLQSAKYTDIKDRKAFEISYEDFIKKFGRCFIVAFETKPLPKRNVPVLLPDDLESQLFIQQLIDIGEVQSGSKDIIKFTTQMLKFLNNFTYWSEEEHFILLTEAEEFKKNSIEIWMIEFRAKYRKVKRQIDSSTPLHELEDDIKDLSLDIVDYIRKQDLSIQGFSPLGIEFSNGHYYALSDNLEVGWHYDWKNKYTK
jgi:hypothetical protein